MDENKHKKTKQNEFEFEIDFQTKIFFLVEKNCGNNQSQHWSIYTNRYRVSGIVFV